MKVFVVTRNGKVILVTAKEERARRVYAALHLSGEKGCLTEAMMDSVDPEGWLENPQA